MKNFQKGFTLIEVLVVLAIIATLLSLVTPRYFDTINRSKETTLRHDLIIMREAIDKFYSDKNTYPDTLDEMVRHKYLRAIPEDPITESQLTWITIAPPDIEAKGSIYDIHSGSPDIAADGTPYATW
ncbi:MAG TPA: prepilin-type N-terminal cleavage/methylation domain-containing protein [Methylotenera sp.]|nr:prepilin-type N-terminal cleavage/methylation domain-containing protein [Methylotenera sp.]HPH08559.1 prepilin-type N-terminal cleavage/methylation domain-containing protein [Methylotenera sp.]HPM48693.1 prepilin-type N-terminal cleavage/methylation domain-containing protein [Methylotenera sp.]